MCVVIVPSLFSGNTNTAFWVFLLVFVVAVQTYPLFACVNAPIPVVGYVLGSLYSNLLYVSPILRLIYSILHLCIVQ